MGRFANSGARRSSSVTCDASKVTSNPSRLATLSLAGIALRVAILGGVVVLASWGAHLAKDALNLTHWSMTGEHMQRMLALAFLAYIALLAVPFVPGAEIGIAMLTAFGAAIAPLIYAATVAAMMLAYTLGRLMPAGTLVRLLHGLRLRRAGDLVARAAGLPPQERLMMLLDGAPPRTIGLALRHRYLALALIVNVPGNSVIGGGGGIMMMAGLSRIFSPVQTLVAVAIAVSPVPLAVMFLGA